MKKLVLWLMMLGLFATRAFGENSVPTGPELVEALRALDAQYTNFYHWMARLYDHQAGAFRMAVSSTTDKNRYPCGIESTGQAISILKESELLPVLPPEMKDRLTHFLQNCQDPKSGFFYDTKWTRESSRLAARSLSYAGRALSDLGAKPLAPLPQTAAIQESYPELKTPVAFLAWLQGLRWKDDAWSSGDQINARISVFHNLTEADRAPLLDVLFPFLEGLQSLSTGLWGTNHERIDYNYVSGAFKVAMVYSAFKREVPRAELLHRSALTCLRTQIPDRYTFVRNPLSLLDYLLPYLPKQIPPAEVAEIIALTAKANARFHEPDGGFSRYPGPGYKGDAPCEWSAGLAEGDLNSGTQAINEVRRMCYKLAGVPEKPLPDAANFYGYLQSMDEAPDASGKAIPRTSRLDF